MRIQLPVWQTTYAHDRRAHRHRCFCCRRILNTDEQIVMFKSLGFHGTKAMHADCVERPFGGSESIFTFKEMAVYVAIEYNVKGFSLSPKSVYRAAGENAIATTVDFSNARLQSFGICIEGWPAKPAAN